MKTPRLLQFLMLVASGFVFLACTSEPVPGPPGADGMDGVDGIDGVDGVDGTASCISCHSNTAREPIFASFEFSAHGSGSVGFAEGRGGDDPTNRCAQCHGEEGFIDFLEKGEANMDGYENPTTIFCSTCHSNHDTFDFENDGPDYALRNDYAQALLLDPTITVDFDGSSNNCITCHQPRTSYVIPAENGSGKYVVTSTRFGPHHGPQSSMLEGVLGANIPGSEGYPGVGSATHRTGSSCVQCHMAPSGSPDMGGHSWVVSNESCVQCHSNGVPDELSGFTEGMATLKSLLENVVGEEYEVDAEGNPVFDMDGNPVGTGVPVVGIIIDLAPDDTDRSNQGIFTTQEAQAAWNYKTLLEDQSNGTHNPGYSRALLTNSIEALQNN
jgi:hypothetical protein